MKKAYNKAVTAYILAFVNKHELQFDAWVGEHIGEIAIISDMYINFDDIRHDIDTEQPHPNILDWYYSCLEQGHNINFRSWCNGARPELLK